MPKATTLQFRAAARKALDAARIKTRYSYTDAPPALDKTASNARKRYVALAVGSLSDVQSSALLQMINTDLKNQGLDTYATYTGGYYLRGVCVAA